MDATLNISPDHAHDFKALRRLEKEASQKGELSARFSDALRRRARELAEAFILDNTDLIPDNFNPAERQLFKVVCEYVGVKKLLGSNAGRTIAQLRTYGLIATAERAVSTSSPRQGFRELAKEGATAFEDIVDAYEEYFTPSAIWYARRTLGKPTLTNSPPVAANKLIQRDTEKLLRWLKERADANSGFLRGYTNAQAAGVLERENADRHSGQVQSRVDFACYLNGVPPLGLTADLQYSMAWQQQGRDWPYPVDEMQRAAKEFRWNERDFDRLVLTTRELPGRASDPWNVAMKSNEESIRAWAYNLGGGPRESQIEVEPATFTPARSHKWSWEEHLLGLDLYFRLEGTSYPTEHPEVIRLSELLRDLAIIRGHITFATLRNPNGVSKKLLNFRRWDPAFKVGGKGILQGGSKLEEDVWLHYAGNRKQLRQASAALVAEIEVARATGVLVSTSVRARDEPPYWVFVCNPKIWHIEKLLTSSETLDTWSVSKSDAKHFAPGQLGLVRVGVDRRTKSELQGGRPLHPGIYALCEVESSAYPGTGADSPYWAKGQSREIGWPTIKLRYLRKYLAAPLTIEEMRKIRPTLSSQILEGFQSATFRVSRNDFSAIVNSIGEDLYRVAGPVQQVTDSSRLRELEEKYLNASPEVKARESKGIERGPIGNQVKKINGHKCQICEALDQNPMGFEKRNGGHYVEAHHVMPVSTKEVGTLSATNVVTLCANHHREVHYGKVDVTINEDHFIFRLPADTLKIMKTKIPLATETTDARDTIGEAECVSKALQVSEGMI